MEMSFEVLSCYSSGNGTAYSALVSGLLAGRTWNRGSIAGRGKRCVASPSRSGRQRNPPNLIYWYRGGPFSGSKSGRGVSL